MPEIGQTIWHYRIIEKIGQGGTGVFYCARVANLGRHLGIMVLPDKIAGGEERLARFQREARLLASLSDSSIAAIQDPEQTGGQALHRTSCRHGARDRGSMTVC